MKKNMSDHMNSKLKKCLSFAREKKMYRKQNVKNIINSTETQSIYN